MPFRERLRVESDGSPSYLDDYVCGRDLLWVGWWEEITCISARGDEANVTLKSEAKSLP